MHLCVYVSFQNILPIILQEMKGNVYITFLNQFSIKLHIKFYRVCV